MKSDEKNIYMSQITSVGDWNSTMASYNRRMFKTKEKSAYSLGLLQKGVFITPYNETP
jgi:hypothetical protein